MMQIFLFVLRDQEYSLANPPLTIFVGHLNKASLWKIKAWKANGKIQSAEQQLND